MTLNQWNPTLYDQKHSFVSNFGLGLVELLAPKPYETILDVGCGTGDLAHKIAEFGADVTGIDASANMVEQAKAKYPALSFSVQDATKLAFYEQFDAVFSNATLHWIKEPETALRSIYTSLKHGGRFVAEFGGQDNVKIITNAIIRQFHAAKIPFSKLDFPWYFPSIAQYTTLLEKVGFRVVLAHHYDRPTPLDGEDGLKNWIHMFAGQFFEKNDITNKQQILDAIENELRPVIYEDGQWIADYKRLRILAIKD